METDLIAVVILNWNGAEMLHQFLPSVQKSLLPGTKIYVADNGSSDNSQSVVSSEFPEVQWIDLKKNYGFAEGYNKALSQIEAKYYILLNSDVEVSENWLTPLLSYMEQHPETAACQPKIRSWKQRELFEYAGAAGGFMDKYGYPFCRGRIMDTVEEDHGQYDTPCHIFWATGAALMIRGTDWKAVGGLDGDFFAHMEEIDLCWRLRARGRMIDCIPESTVYHVGAATLKRDNPKKTFLNFRNNLLMLYKNLPEADVDKILRIRFWLDRVAWLKFVLSGDIKNAAAIHQAHKEFRQIKGKFKNKRLENCQTATESNFPELMPKLLLWEYFIKRRKTYRQLFP